MNYIKKSSKEIKVSNCRTLWGFESSQVTPVCPHKSFVVSQLKAFEVNELYQSTKIVWSSECNAPF